jgi:hypothetical protein
MVMDPIQEIEMDRMRREELMREVEKSRLVRRLRKEKASGTRASLDRVMDAIRGALGMKPSVGDCEG